MPYIKITDLPEISQNDIESDDVFMIDDVSLPESKKVTMTTLKSKVLEDLEQENYFFSLFTS